ncbi:MAG: FadR family transcriptional regulator [Tabrizicola sp.]|nr:FadR family transcriptional regulator [Tabrizicola sp.]
MSNDNASQPVVAADSLEDPSGSAVDQVLAELRRLIAEGGFKVGDRLPTERELCERFSASRNTVREAMRMLKAFGVVEVRPKVGATIVDQRMDRAFDLFSFNVTEISRKTFDDIQGFRELIETGAVMQIFASMTPAALAELRDINLQMVQAPTVVAASEHDLRFHTRLVSLIGNKAILDVYRIMTPVILRIMQRGKTRRTIEGETFHEHEAILDAMEKRDGLGFQYLMRTHLRSGLSTFRTTEAGPTRSSDIP